MDAVVDNRVDCATLARINLRQPMVPQIHAALRARIIDLSWKPGQIVAKDEVAAALGVSQSPVREALLKLEEDGLVVVVPRSRTVVSLINVRQSVEAQFLRLGVEIEIVRVLAARGMAAARAADLDLLLKNQAVFAGHGALAEFTAVDEDFHHRLYRLAGIEGLWTIVTARRAHIDRLRHLDLPSRGKMESVLREHHAILDAIRARDPAAAEATLRTHLSGTLGRAGELKARFPEYFGED